MSRKLKRVIYAIEEKQAGYWRVVWCCNCKKEAVNHCDAKPGRQLAAYDRNEGNLRPGRCLWMVEARISLAPWVVHGVYPTLLKARAAMSRLERPKFGLPRETRLLRFVRRKERGY